MTFLGNELFDGDEVVTIQKNSRATGGRLYKTRIKIDDKGTLKFDDKRSGLYVRGIANVCIKVIKENS